MNILLSPPYLENGMAVMGDVEKFVTMADMRIASVEAAREGVRVGVISNQDWNPVTVGFAPRRPRGVEVRGSQARGSEQFGPLEGRACRLVLGLPNNPLARESGFCRSCQHGNPGFHPPLIKR